jgi:uncharacterized repeat protein (TIGR03803 family)
MNANSLPCFAKTLTHWRTLGAALSLAIMFATAIVATPAALQAQTFTVLHNFTGGGDGATPKAGLTMDAAENFYGTTYLGGTGYGVVFKLKHSGSGWVLTPLYSFAGGNDGANPFGRVAIAADGTLYGTTYLGGGTTGCMGSGCGTVFHLTPSPEAPKKALAPWNETVIFSFTGVYTGANPQGDIVFDRSGNICGTTVSGGNLDYGAVYQLTPSGNSWSETIIYSPGDFNLFQAPYGGVVFDSAGNLYGTSSLGGYGGDGNVYRLSPAGSGWKAQSLHQFDGTDGAEPIGGLILDSAGDLYGTTSIEGGGYGTVFQITFGNGGWTFTTLHTFPTGKNYGGPIDQLFMDRAGNLYGTTFYDGAYGSGSVFKLAPSDGGWIYSSLHDFTGGSDGEYPWSSLIVDTNGNLYGTTAGGGGYGLGVVFQITP